jgi:hypothetical protein
MPRPTIDQIRGLGDFATNYQWNVIISGVPNAVSFPDSQDINLRCQSSTIPKATGGKLTTELRGHKVHQSSAPEYNGPITLTMTETVDNVITQWIMDWREACAEVKTGVHQMKSEVEAVIILERLNRQDEKIWQYELVGCFLEDYEPGGDLAATADTLKPTLSISYDYFVDKPA